LIAAIPAMSLTSSRRYLLADHVERWSERDRGAVAAALESLPEDLTVVLIVHGKPAANIAAAVRKCGGEVLTYEAPRPREMPRRLAGWRRQHDLRRQQRRQRQSRRKRRDRWRQRWRWQCRRHDHRPWRRRPRLPGRAYAAGDATPNSTASGTRNWNWNRNVWRPARDRPRLQQSAAARRHPKRQQWQGRRERRRRRWRRLPQRLLDPVG
jgi:hypothetical protein